MSVVIESGEYDSAAVLQFAIKSLEKDYGIEAAYYPFTVQILKVYQAVMRRENGLDKGPPALLPREAVKSNA